MGFAATASNPHPDDEYLHIRQPRARENWGPAFCQLWERIQELGRGQKCPLITLNVSRWAEQLDLSRKTIQRFLEMLTTSGSSGKPLALKVKRPGKANQYKIRWDFTYKRKKSPDDPEPCNHRSKARQQGGATFSLNNPFNKKKDKNTRDSKGVYDPINWNQMMYKLREKLQSNQLAAVIGKFIKQRNYHEDHPSRIRYFWTQLTRFVQKIRKMEFLSLREAYHDIMELLHKIMFIDYNTARERNRFPWEKQNWNEGYTSKIGDLIQQSGDSESKKKTYEEQLEEGNEFEKKRQKKIERLKKWEREQESKH